MVIWLYGYMVIWLYGYIKKVYFIEHETKIFFFGNYVLCVWHLGFFWVIFYGLSNFSITRIFPKQIKS